ncbi:unnamed protein product [Gordionus sp. m RMFG-2023]
MIVSIYVIIGDRESIINYNKNLLENNTTENESLNVSDQHVSKLRTRAYIWGGGYYGALGNERLLRPKVGKNIRYSVKAPMHLYFADKYKIKNIACGYGYTMFVSNKKLYGCGINVNSQIGFHEARKNSGKGLNFILEPVPIMIPSDRIIKAAAGQNHTLVLTSDGVFSFGCNRFGQCAREVITDENYENNPLIYKIPSKHFDSPVNDVVCGENTSYFLTASGLLYSCGHGLYGQIGDGQMNLMNPVPVLLNFASSSDTTMLSNDDKIIKVACRSNTTMALTAKGKVFAWGSGEHSQFTLFSDLKSRSNILEGHKFDLSATNFPRPLLLFDSPDERDCKDVPKDNAAISNHGTIKGRQIVDIACTNSMCCVLDGPTGTLHVWGMGPLGLGPLVNHSQIPLAIPKPLFFDEPVVQIVAGYSQFCAKTRAGNLFTWGDNTCGALGLGLLYSKTTKSLNQYHFPQQVSLMQRNIKDISAGYDHIAIVA